MKLFSYKIFLHINQKLFYMKKNKIIIAEQFELERKSKISDFKRYFDDSRKEDSDRKADWNFIIPQIVEIEKLPDAFVYQNKQSVEITYSTEEINFCYTVHFNGQMDSLEHGKLIATINVVNTFVTWALNNL